MSVNHKDATERVPPSSAAPPPVGITAMRASAADCTSSAGSRFRFKEHRVEIGKVFEFEPRNFSSDEMFDRLQRCNLFAVHEREGVANILGTTGPADAMHV